MAGSLPESPDNLIVRTLRPPMLNEVMGSGGMRDYLWDIAQEIKARYIAKVPKDKGKLAATARLKAFRSTKHPDRRWMVDFTVGGIMGVDYADDVEREFGTLASVLRDMGYNIGDVVTGPTGRKAKDAPPKKVRTTVSADEKSAMAKADLSAKIDEGYAKMSEAVDRVMRPGRRYGSKAYNADIEELRKTVAQIEEQYGPIAAGVGKTAIASYEAMRDAKAEAKKYDVQGGQVNYRAVWYELRGGKRVRMTKDFTYSEDAEEWTQKNLAGPMKGIPNAREYNKLRSRDDLSNSVRDSSNNVYGVIQNVGGHSGVYRNGNQ